MHNKKDPGVPFDQGLGWLLALRELHKPGWLLQYDEGEHGLYPREGVDYTLRLTQFFDYYLKGQLPPIWMTEGVPDRLKGIETGYGLDTIKKP